VNNYLQWTWKRTVWSNLLYCPGIWLDEFTKTGEVPHSRRSVSGTCLARRGIRFLHLLHSYDIKIGISGKKATKFPNKISCFMHRSLQHKDSALLKAANCESRIRSLKIRWKAFKEVEEICGCFNEDKMKAKAGSEEKELNWIKRLDYWSERV
jgi:hypothetical protein